MFGIYIDVSVTVDAPKTKQILANFPRKTLIILHFYKDINVVHKLTINLLERV